jgi:hypothetical protein
MDAIQLCPKETTTSLKKQPYRIKKFHVQRSFNHSDLDLNFFGKSLKLSGVISDGN